MQMLQWKQEKATPDKSDDDDDDVDSNNDSDDDVDATFFQHLEKFWGFFRVCLTFLN